jgi:hypothetical protein
MVVIVLVNHPAKINLLTTNKKLADGKLDKDIWLAALKIPALFPSVVTAIDRAAFPLEHRFDRNITNPYYPATALLAGRDTYQPRYLSQQHRSIAEAIWNHYLSYKAKVRALAL